MTNEDVENRLCLTNIVANQFILKKDTNPLSYCFDDFFSDFVEKNNIKVFENIPKIESEFFLGVTVRSENSIAIFINPDVYEPRKRFSKSHECNHILFDMNYKLKTQKLFNVDNNPTFYTTEELEQENLANAGAGVLMLPDIVIVKYLETNYSFYKMADNLRISNAALYNRLIQFCMNHFGYDSEYASSLIKRLQNTGGRQHINMALSGYGSTVKKQILLDFENSI